MQICYYADVTVHFSDSEMTLKFEGGLRIRAGKFEGDFRFPAVLQDALHGPIEYGSGPGPQASSGCSSLWVIDSTAWASTATAVDSEIRT